MSFADVLWWLMLIVYVPCCIGLIVVVLLQKGKGAGFAGAFGLGGGSDTVFGPRASKSLPVRLTQVMAGLFMVLALFMSLLSGQLSRGVAPEKEKPTDALTGLEDLGIAAAPHSTATPEETAAAAAGTTASTPVTVQETPAATPGEPAASSAPAADTAAAPAATQSATPPAEGDAT